MRRTRWTASAAELPRRGLQHAVRSGDDEDGTPIDRYLEILLRGLRS